MIVSLWRLFEVIFDTGKVPGEWARGLVVPVPKGGDRERVENYRGITLLSVVGKVFAQILHHRLSGWLERGGISGARAGGV